LQSSASKAKPRQRTYPGSEVLAGQSPRKVLAKILRGDPLGMDSRCADRVAHHANLVDPDRLYDHATAWVAHQAFGYDGTPPLDEFLTTCIDSTIRTLLDEDIEVQRQGIPALGDPDPSSTTSVSHWLADCLGIEPPIARKCAVVYNNLPIPVREAFWAVVIQSKPLERAAPAKAKARVRYALAMMSTLGTTPEPNPDPGAPSWNYAEDIFLGSDNTGRSDR
jgi:hypothetical protein